jgi:hypothetical protein
LQHRCKNENSLSFAIVKLWTNIGKRLATIGLMGLFLFVHFLKLSHHHTGSEQDSGCVTSQDIIKAAACGVCDYHFTKDSECTLPVALPAPRVPFKGYTFSFTSQIPSSIGLLFSDRGPPVTA